MRRLLISILLLATLWLPAQAQKFPLPPQKKPTPVCEVPSLPYTVGQLQDIFTTFNRMYWDGKLPATVVVWTALKEYGETDKLPDGRFVIRLDSVKNQETNVAKTTILHEMCHIKTWGDPCHVKADHPDCSRWLIELHRIMLEGAFDDLV